MYNLVESHAEALTEDAETWNLARLWQHWLAKRSVRRLASYEDHVLRDMGIERADLDWAARLPIWRNATQELEERGLRRRLHVRH
ncbi:MAG: DUF1127 domain-containing protein [Aestuariivirgaceae bacterium]|jgi:uncharacterized protein YjiS (DUF1127 family)